MAKLNDHMVDLMAVGLVGEINKAESEHEKHAVIAKFLDEFAKEVSSNGYESTRNFGWKEEF